MNICIFCSAQDIAEEYTCAATDLATRIAQAGHCLVWGGSNVGTMKVIADVASAAGGDIVGVTVERFQHRARQDATTMHITKDLAERKAKLIEISDAFVALPGGTGTLDEAMTVIESRKYGVHKPMGFLNTNGFYDGLRTQFDHMEQEGFLYEPLSDIAYFAATPEQLLEYLEESVRSGATFDHVEY